VDHFWQNIPGWADGITPLYELTVADAPSVAHFVEVGSFKGRSAAFMAVEIINSGKQIKFDCVDTWLGSEENQAGQSWQDADVVAGTLFDAFTANMAPVEGRYTAIRQSSVAAAELYADATLDFVFIDAAHDYESIKTDINAWLPKVKAGGILAGHDYGFDSVQAAVTELLPGGEGVYGHCWVFRKAFKPRELLTSVKYSDIPAFCINLNERPERWLSAQVQFAALSWPVTRWPGVVTDVSLYPRLPSGHCGLIESCRQLWRHCLSAGLDVVAIFEDDAVFPTDFAATFPQAYAELPDDWLVWHLHAATAGTTPIGNYVVKFKTSCWGTHGYLINARGVAKLLEVTEAFTEDNTYTADDILTTCLLRAGLSPYGVTPARTLCFQSGESSDIPATAALGFWQGFKTRYYR
jgi:hypothetical protein